MKAFEQTRLDAADLHWLATLLTGCPEIAVDVTVQVIDSAGDPEVFFSNWMLAWARRLVVAKALAGVGRELAASACRTALKGEKHSALPPRSWVLDEGTTKSDLERALLLVDLFPRAAVLLLIFEGVPLADAAILLDAELDLVRKGQAAGVVELTMNLARMKGWRPKEINSNQLAREFRHA
jgi:DNA-directed RNA polymerase specialized sigma24 family protein